MENGGQLLHAQGLPYMVTEKVQQRGVLQDGKNPPSTICSSQMGLTFMWGAYSMEGSSTQRELQATREGFVDSEYKLRESPGHGIPWSYLDCSRSLSVLPEKYTGSSAPLNIHSYVEDLWAPSALSFVSQKQVCHKDLACVMKYRSLEMPFIRPSEVFQQNKDTRAA